MPRSADQFRQSQMTIEQMEEAIAVEQRRIHAAKDKAEKEKAFKAASKQKVAEYISYRAQLQLETGKVSPKVMKAYLGQHDLTTFDGQMVYIKAVRSLLTNTLYGLSKVPTGYRFMEQTYATVADLKKAITALMGNVELNVPNDRWFDIALERTLTGTSDDSLVAYRIALDTIIKEAPTDVDYADYFYLENLGLADGLSTAPTVINA